MYTTAAHFRMEDGDTILWMRDGDVSYLYNSTNETNSRDELAIVEDGGTYTLLVFGKVELVTTNRALAYETAGVSIPA